MPLGLSHASVARFETAIERRGYGRPAVEVRQSGEFVGFVGLADVEEAASASPRPWPSPRLPTCAPSR